MTKPDPDKQYLTILAESCGYLDVVEKGDAGLCAIQPLMFTYAVLAELNMTGYGNRWCYHTYKDAKAALDAWDGADGTEPSGWHRHPKSGRRRDENGNEEVYY